MDPTRNGPPSLIQSQRFRNTSFFFAIALFLLFTGTSAYQILYPIHHWNVECSLKDIGKVWSWTTPDRTEAQQIKDFALADTDGEKTCTVIPVRRWYKEGRR